MAVAERMVSAHFRRVNGSLFLGSHGMITRAHEDQFRSAAVIRTEKVTAFSRELDLDLIHEAGDVRLWRLPAASETALAAVAEFQSVELGADGISLAPVQV